MFVTFSIWAFLFESIEQEDQASPIQKKDMLQIRRLHKTICKRLDLDIFTWKDKFTRAESLFLYLKMGQHLYDLVTFYLSEFPPLEQAVYDLHWLSVVENYLCIINIYILRMDMLVC